MLGDVLNSWKEIASYVGRGVRTVQRWEQELEFPVRRPRGKNRSAVIALKPEVDIWLRTPHGAEVNGRRHISFINHTRLINNTEILQQRTAVLVSRSEKLTQELTRAMTITRAMQIFCRGARSERKNWTAELNLNSDAVKKNVARPKEPGHAGRILPPDAANGSLKQPQTA